MKVKDLITELQKHSPEQEIKMEVCIWINNGGVACEDDTCQYDRVYISLPIDGISNHGSKAPITIDSDVNETVFEDFTKYYA